MTDFEEKRGQLCEKHGADFIAKVLLCTKCDDKRSEILKKRTEALEKIKNHEHTPVCHCYCSDYSGFSNPNDIAIDALNEKENDKRK